jgi:hypothetical protein
LFVKALIVYKVKPLRKASLPVPRRDARCRKVKICAAFPNWLGSLCERLGFFLLFLFLIDAVFSQGELHPKTVIAMAVTMIGGFVLIIAGILLEEG